MNSWSCLITAMIKCKCGKRVESSNKEFFKCVFCNNTCRYSSLKVDKIAKISFPGEGEEITVYPYQLAMYVNADIAAPDDVFTEAMLKDEESVIISNKANVCVCFL